MLGLMIMMMLASWEKIGLTIWHIWSLRFYDDKKYFCMIFFSQKITKKYFKKKSIFLYFKKYLAITLTSKIERERESKNKKKACPKTFFFRFLSSLAFRIFFFYLQSVNYYERRHNDRFRVSSFFCLSLSPSHVPP